MHLALVRDGIPRNHADTSTGWNTRIGYRFDIDEHRYDLARVKDSTGDLSLDVLGNFIALYHVHRYC